MQVPPHFEFLSSWLRGQHRSVERVEAEQSSATHLVSTAEYELGRLRRELSGLALEPGSGIAGLSDVDILATKVDVEENAQVDQQVDDAARLGERQSIAVHNKTTSGWNEGKRVQLQKDLPRQTRNLSSDAA